MSPIRDQRNSAASTFVVSHPFAKNKAKGWGTAFFGTSIAHAWTG
jgi:hypothetical protein